MDRVVKLSKINRWRIAPSSRHRKVEQLLGQQIDGVNVRQLAS